MYHPVGDHVLMHSHILNNLDGLFQKEECSIRMEGLEVDLESMSSRVDVHAAMCVVMHRNGSRWFSAPCETPLQIHQACKRPKTRTISVDDRPGKEPSHQGFEWAVGPDRTSCEKGFTAAVPTNGYENRCLYEALQHSAVHVAGVWIHTNLRQRQRKTDQNVQHHDDDDRDHERSVVWKMEGDDDHDHEKARAAAVAS